jgi:hypothetical protein
MGNSTTVSNFNYIINLISGEETDINIKLQRYNKTSELIKIHLEATELTQN